MVCFAVLTDTVHYNFLREYITGLLVQKLKQLNLLHIFSQDISHKISVKHSKCYMLLAITPTTPIWREQCLRFFFINALYLILGNLEK